MKPYVIITLVLASLLSFVHALPASPTVFTVTITDTKNPHTLAASANNTLTINGTTVLSSGLLNRDPATGWCNLNIGLVEHFQRGGSTGGRRASIFVGALMDGASKDIWWRWDNGDPGYPNGRATERRIDDWTIRIYDLIRRGDSLAFSWFHPDNNNPNYEWMDFNFNGNKWNDRDKDCGKGHCCRTGPFYGDGKDRKLRGIDCGFSCP